MYAIVQVGGKQYNVKEKDVIEVEKQEGKEGKEIALNKVLLVSSGKDDIVVGAPYVKDAKVAATVLRQLKARKTISYKYRRRKSSHWTKGHRQQLTRLAIKKISVG